MWCIYALILGSNHIYVCGVLKKSFTRSLDLKTNLRSHTGVRRFTCVVCKKSFIHSWKLKVHLQNHTGEWPFTCGVCKKSFNQSFTLKLHLCTHNGQWPFMFGVCKKSFKQSDTLKVLILESGHFLVAYPDTYSADTRVYFWAQIVWGVMKTHNLQQPCSTVTKSLLVTMWKHVRINWKLSVGNAIEPRKMVWWVCVPTCDSCWLSVWTCDRLQIYLAPLWLIFSVHYPWVRGIVCMRLDNSFGVIISVCYKNILQKQIELGHCGQLDMVHALVLTRHCTRQ
jgi:hypothetical protein